MITFTCPKCSKKHSAREKMAGRRGFCNCGAVLVVPGLELSSASQPPKMIADLDFNAGRRNAIYASLAGVMIATILVYAIFFYDIWERKNKTQLMAMAREAEQLMNGGQRPSSIDEYQKLIDTVGNHELSDSDLTAKVPSGTVRD
jgi:hypothetical protein